MSDLISRKALNKALGDTNIIFPKDKLKMWELIENALAVKITCHSCTIDKKTGIPVLMMTIGDEAHALSFPPIDAVEVVRCKDCRYEGKEDDCPLLSVKSYTQLDDYCSCGERRTDETD